jgi:uncharacterized protein
MAQTAISGVGLIRIRVSLIRTWRLAAAATISRATSVISPRAAAISRGAAVILIDVYRAFLSPLFTGTMGPACRFEPSCSAYAREAIIRHGVKAGGRMTVGRLARCRPAGGWGRDPVPQERPAKYHDCDMK